MIAGETLAIQHTETGDVPFTASSGTISIQIPNGTFVTPAPAVTITPNTSNITQTFSSVLPSTIGGVYTLIWTLAIGSSILKRIETYFAAWTDIYGEIRELLQLDNNALTDDAIDRRVAYTYMLLQSTFSVLPNYGDLTGNDRHYADEALSFLVALRMRQYKPKTVPTSEPTRIRQQSSDFEFARPLPVPTPLSPESARAADLSLVMMDEAVLNLGRISSIKAFYDTLRTGPSAFHIFRLDGPTRHSIANFGSPTLYSIAANILSQTIDFTTPAGAAPLDLLLQ